MEDLGHPSAAKRPAQRLISASRNTTQEHRASYGLDVGIGDGLPAAEGESVGAGNAKVGAGEDEAAGDSLGDGVSVGEAWEAGVGNGVGVGVGIKSAQ